MSRILKGAHDERCYRESTSSSNKRLIIACVQYFLITATFSAAAELFWPFWSIMNVITVGAYRLSYFSQTRSSRLINRDQWPHYGGGRVLYVRQRLIATETCMIQEMQKGGGIKECIYLQQNWTRKQNLCFLWSLPSFSIKIPRKPFWKWCRFLIRLRFAHCFAEVNVRSTSVLHRLSDIQPALHIDERQRSKNFRVQIRLV